MNLFDLFSTLKKGKRSIPNDNNFAQEYSLNIKR